MKPEQFIREYGPKFVSGIPESATHVSGFTGQVYRGSSDNLYVWDGANWHKSIYKHTRGMILVSKLKRLVESLDLVNFHNGLKQAKHYLTQGYCLSEKHTWNDLAQAIRVHESIYGGGE
ncbi:hypothetical protein I0P17_04550 [Acinetobacter baumannii]|uniref:hypothetical protein n=1 Tax=Acinetobacter baumannii TaxID=470 RepID=UPI0018AF94A2|nr:hypothetical protein [Acinetobacter baumannii]MBF9225269.1 hypothetical protein [Acinetobacter baumannii]